MDDKRESREVFKILFLCLLWYVVSSSSNVVGKLLLSDFPYPMTVTMVQLTSITLYSGPFFNLWGVRQYKNSDVSWNYYFKLIVPLALGKFVGNVFSHVSIWKVPVSYAHTGMNFSHFYKSHFFYAIVVYSHVYPRGTIVFFCTTCLWHMEARPYAYVASEQSPFF